MIRFDAISFHSEWGVFFCMCLQFFLLGCVCARWSTLPENVGIFLVVSVGFHFIHIQRFYMTSDLKLFDIDDFSFWGDAIFFSCAMSVMCWLHTIHQNDTCDVATLVHGYVLRTNHQDIKTNKSFSKLTYSIQLNTPILSDMCVGIRVFTLSSIHSIQIE